MREIKFRAFDTKENTYLDGMFSICSENGKLVTECDMFALDFDRSERYVIEQYTGLKDKNGEEIYEGDKVYFTIFDHNGNDNQYKGVVKFHEGGWKIWENYESEYYGADGAFDLYWVFWQDDEIEIIGNIHDGVKE